MKKKRLAAGALALAVSITACGCGEQLYELTDEEEAVVVHYATRAVTKFNKRQSEGISDVTMLKARMQQEEERRREEEQKTKEEQQKQETKKDEKQDNSKTESGQQSDQSQSSEQPKIDYVSLGQALKLNGIEAVYKGYEVAPTYMESASYMIRANSGKELLVLHVNLKNTGNKKAKCNILSKMPTFRLNINGDLNVSADTTILLDDLGTYQGSLKAGATKKTVLVFQVKEGTVKKVKSMDLEVTINGTGSTVQLVSD